MLSSQSCTNSFEALAELIEVEERVRCPCIRAVAQGRNHTRRQTLRHQRGCHRKLHGPTSVDDGVPSYHREHKVYLEVFRDWRPDSIGCRVAHEHGTAFR